MPSLLLLLHFKERSMFKVLHDQYTYNAIKWLLFKIDYKNIFVSQRSSSIDDTDGPHFHQISDCLICFKTAKSKKSVTSQLQNDMWYGINLGCFEIHKLFLDFTFFPPSVWTVIWAVRIAAAPEELWNINDVDHIFFLFCYSSHILAEHLVFVLRWPLKEHQIYHKIIIRNVRWIFATMN